MISLISLAVNAIANLIITIAKAVFSMLTWFFKAFFHVFKLFFCFLPLTSVTFALLLCVNVYILFSANGGLLALGTGDMTIHTTSEHTLDLPVDGIVHETDMAMSKSNYVIINMSRDLQKWWMNSVYSYKGSLVFIFLVILTILMFVPVVTVFLAIAVFASFNKILFFAVVADAVIYVLRALLGTGFVTQVLGRYYRLFPEAGKRHYEKSYTKLLKQQSDELREELRLKKSKKDDFYGDDEFEDEYDEDFDEEYDEDYDEEYDDYDEDTGDDPDEYYEDEDCDDDYDDEYDDEDDDEYYEEDYEDDKEPSHNARSSSFDFFAGCNSRESVDKKYKTLVKLYHPDNMDGDTAALSEINVQYANAKKRFPL